MFWNKFRSKFASSSLIKGYRVHRLRLGLKSPCHGFLVCHGKSLPFTLTLLVIRPSGDHTDLRVMTETKPLVADVSKSLIHELLLLLYNTTCLVLRTVHTILVFLPCLLALPLTLLPWPLPHVSTKQYVSLLCWCAEMSGPVYVKLAQWAATRRDLLPPTVCNGLARLQSQTSPHSWNQTERILKEEFGAEFRELYNRIWIEKEPVGSGCCAQVYHGWVDDQEVAIKVVHPTMERNLELDLMVISAGARFISWVFPSTSWLNLGAVIKEFETLMMGQTDMRQEAANLNKFRNNFRENPDIVFPEPLSGLCRRRVLFETWVDGEPITHFLKPTVDISLRQRLAGLGIDMLLQMVFHDNYWHGDLHPGNLLVTTEGKLAVLDTGIAANLEEEDRDSLAKTFLAVVRGDGARVGELFLERSFHQCEDRAAFLAEMEDIVTKARSQQLCLERVDVSVLLHKVFSTLMMHKVQLKASFSSVVIAIAIVEGLGRSLDSNLDLVTKALPYILRGAEGR